MGFIKKLGLIGGLTALVLGTQGCHSTQKMAKSDSREFNFNNVKTETTYQPTKFAYIKEYNQDSGAASYMQEVHRLEGLGVNVIPCFSGCSSKGYEITVPEGYSLPKIASDLSDVMYSTITSERLFNENQDILGKNPNSIKPGMKLKIRTGGGEVNIL